MKRSWFVLAGAGLLLTWGLFQSDNLDAFIKSGQLRATVAREPAGTAQPPGSSPASGHVPLSTGPIASALNPQEKEAKLQAEAAAAQAKLVRDTQLLDRIRQEAEKRKLAPINAKIDRVWKAIPGLNGRELDVEATWQQAVKLLESGAESFPLVYKEIPPSVKLEDLGAQPIYKGNPNKPMIALMINVAWGDEFLPKMLEVLDKEQVKATFFLDGSWLKKSTETAKTIGGKGHELSNHAYSHKNMSQLGRQQATEEITKTESLLNGLGIKNTLFAPPSGDYNEQTVQIASELGLKTVLWTLDTVDWKNPGADTILRRLTPRLEPGALILMHPTVSSSEALEQLIRNIKEKGFQLGTVSELLSPSRLQAPEPESIRF
ncbi:polysaccharide deacetylase family protein [Paenibacillus koleovorans]|uniref:polysaccharide deacetylase family protein n=1 Tax=Paenibacillus koleovorans TaxID=121608 RepID=UPI001FE4F09B|nr:polysaccharide deacetylase family protein [Paenibacillus koleovorans]